MIYFSLSRRQISSLKAGDYNTARACQDLKLAADIAARRAARRTWYLHQFGGVPDPMPDRRDLLEELCQLCRDFDIAELLADDVSEYYRFSYLLEELKHV